MNTADTPEPVSPWWADKYISDPYLIPEQKLCEEARLARPPACVAWYDESGFYAAKLYVSREKIASLRAQLEALEAEYEADNIAFQNFNRLYNTFPEAQAYTLALNAAHLVRQKLKIPGGGK